MQGRGGQDRGGGRAGRLWRNRSLAGALTGLAAVVMLASGCGEKAGSGSQPVASVSGGATSTSAAASGDGSTLAFAKCMRERGISNFPDPNAQGKLDLDANKLGVNSPQYKDAFEACKPLLPGGGNPQGPSADDLAAGVKYAQCMRDNGVRNFPDPNADGGTNVDAEKLGVDPMGPVFKAADEKCKKILEDASGGRPRVESPGGPGGPGGPVGPGGGPAPGGG